MSPLHCSFGEIKYASAGLVPCTRSVVASDDVPLEALDVLVGHQVLELGVRPVGEIRPGTEGAVGDPVSVIDLFQGIARAVRFLPSDLALVGGFEGWALEAERGAAVRYP
jgi:hypothetical protein